MEYLRALTCMFQNDQDRLKPIYSFSNLWWKWKFSLMVFVYRVLSVLKAMWIVLSETINTLRKLHQNIFGMHAPENSTIELCTVHTITPSCGHISLNFDMPFKLILRRFEVFSDVWSENAVVFERLIEIHSNPPYYGFNHFFPSKILLNKKLLWNYDYK